MDIIKQYFQLKSGFVLFILRTNLYSESLQYFLTLFEEAKKDFPDIKAKDIAATEYDGDTIRGTRGIEFRIKPKGKAKVKIPKEYKKAIIIYPKK